MNEREKIPNWTLRMLTSESHWVPSLESPQDDFTQTSVAIVIFCLRC